jgi:hypothetical protein
MDGREDAAMIKDSEFEEFFTSQYGRLCWLGFLLSRSIPGDAVLA